MEPDCNSQMQALLYEKKHMLYFDNLQYYCLLLTCKNTPRINIPWNGGFSQKIIVTTKKIQKKT